MLVIDQNSLRTKEVKKHKTLSLAPNSTWAAQEVKGHLKLLTWTAIYY